MIQSLLSCIDMPTVSRQTTSVVEIGQAILELVASCELDSNNILKP